MVYGHLRKLLSYRQKNKLLEENLGNYSTDPKLGKDCKTGLQKVWWWWFSH